MSKKSVFEFLVPPNEFSLSNPEVASKNANKIVLIDEDGDRIIFKGSDLTYKNGLLTSGVVDSFVFQNEAGKKLVSFTGIDFDAATVSAAPPQALLEYTFIFGLRHDNLMLGSKGSDEMNGMLGNDVIKGFAGGDRLSGGVGNDVLTGGSGEDEFSFSSGDGRDRITDFDADFGDGKQDLLDADFGDIVSITNVKGNATINFGDGDVVTLVGVKASEIDISDFAS